MKKKLKLRMLALASLLATSSAAMAIAPPQGPGTVTLTNTLANLWTASIGDVPGPGLFTDVYHFVPAATPGSVAWESVVNTSFFGFANITFLAADVNGTPLFTGSVPIIPGLIQNYATLLPSPVTGPLTLTIHGVNTGGGSYGGNMNVMMAPVPEPATYGMLLGGLGILAFLARGRRSS